MRFIPALLALLLLSANVSAQLPAPQPVSEGAFHTGEYRNMLAEWGLSDEEIQARIDAYFQQLFYGGESERIYYPVGDDMAYIMDINNNDIRTEGMSYGMMIAAQLDKKEEFDRLWTWARTNMYQEDGPYKGYFCWHAFDDGSCIDPNPASDGEIWYVTSLFFAAARWGNGEGIYNYQEQANIILDTMLHAAEAMPGAAANTFNEENKLVVFVAQVGRNRTFTDPSYHAPHYYELWARWANKDNAFWADAAVAAREHWHKAAHPDTGLMANYTTFEGEPRPSGDYGEVYYADAWRIGMMVAMDHSWFAADPWQLTWADTYQKFFYDMGIGAYTSRFLIDGTPEGSQHRSGGHIAMNAVASLAASDPRVWEFIEEFWETPIPTGRYRYYDGLLQMFALLQLSGNFRVYTPEVAPLSP